MISIFGECLLKYLSPILWKINILFIITWFLCDFHITFILLLTIDSSFTYPSISSTNPYIFMPVFLCSFCTSITRIVMNEFLFTDFLDFCPLIFAILSRILILQALAFALEDSTTRFSLSGQSVCSVYSTPTLRFSNSSHKI